MQDSVVLGLRCSSTGCYTKHTNVQIGHSHSAFKQPQSRQKSQKSNLKHLRYSKTYCWPQSAQSIQLKTCFLSVRPLETQDFDNRRQVILLVKNRFLRKSSADTHSLGWWRCAILSRINFIPQSSSDLSSSEHTQNDYIESNEVVHFHSEKNAMFRLFGVYNAFLGHEQACYSTPAEDPLDRRDA